MSPKGNKVIWFLLLIFTAGPVTGVFNMLFMITGCYLGCCQETKFFGILKKGMTWPYTCGYGIATGEDIHF